MNIIALDSPLPQAPDAERAVLGAIMTNSKNYWRIVTTLTERDFFKDAHRAIFRAIAAIAEEGGAELDTLTVKHELFNLGLLDAAGGHAYVSSLCDGIPDLSNVERYARIVKEKSDLRRILTTCNTAMRAAVGSDANASEISQTAAEGLQSLAVAPERQSRPMYEVVRDVAARAEKRALEGRTRAILTGFPMLDYHRVLRRKALTVFAAPSSHGKSIFMLNACSGVIKHDAATKATLYSLEMGDEDVSEPLLSMLSRVPLTLVQEYQSNLTDEQQARLAQSIEWVRSSRERLFFADKIRDFDSLAADCRQRKAVNGLDVIFVDYLQLIRGMNERTPEQAVDRIARLLFQLAQDLDIAVVTGSQVNKEHEKRASGRLSLHDMKHGAVIGEHARIVCMFQRPRQDDKSNQDIPWCQVSFQVEKNSGRETGDIVMHADMRIQTFSEGTCEENDCPRVRQPGSSRGLFGRDS